MWLPPLCRRAEKISPVLTSLIWNTAPFGMTFLPPLNQSSCSVVILPLLALATADSIFLSVALPATPSAVRPYFFWNALTALSVVEPNEPSTYAV